MPYDAATLISSLSQEHDNMKKKTAKELFGELRQDPNWVDANRAKYDILAKEHAAHIQDQRPLIDDIKKFGRHVDTVWDLVNANEPYPELIDVLTTHLVRNYQPKVLEGIARALTTSDAKVTQAPKVVLTELQRRARDADETRWALANALTVIATPDMLHALERLLDDTRFADCHVALRLAVKRLRQ